MKRIFAWLLVLSCLLSAAGSALAGEPLGDVDEGLIRARAEHKPVFVDLMAKWCHSCFAMKADVFHGPQWDALMRRVVFVESDTDSFNGKKWLDKLEVASLPTYVVLDGDGAEMGRLVGEMPRTRFYAEMDRILSGAGSIEKMKEKAVATGAAASVREALEALVERNRIAPGLAWYDTLPAQTQQRVEADPAASSVLARMRMKQASLQIRDAIIAARRQGTTPDMTALQPLVQECRVQATRALSGDPGCARPDIVNTLLLTCMAQSAPDVRKVVAREQMPALQSLLKNDILSPQPTCPGTREGILTAVSIQRDVLGDPAGAQAVLEQGIAAAKRDLADGHGGVDVKRNRGTADVLAEYLDRAGHKDEAVALLKQLADAYGDDYNYPLRYGSALVEQGKAAEALPYLQRASDVAFDDVRGQVARVQAKALKLLGRDEEAQRLLDSSALLPVTEAYTLRADTSTPGVVRLQWSIAPNYYLYCGQMKFAGGPGITLGQAQLPNGKKFHDQYLGDVEIYHDTIVATIPYTAESGAQRLRFSVTYQGCHETDPKICYPPYTRQFDVELPAGAGAAAGAGTIGAGLLMAVLLALGGGLVLNLMPCVLPILSMKAVGLLESNQGTQALRRHALFYSAGVICSFIALGSVLFALRSAGHALGWGAQLQQPLAIGVLACVMTVIGLSMSGVVHFGTSLGNTGHSLASRKGAVGDFFTGVLAVVVASPCTAPFMGAALAYAFSASPLAALLVFLALGVGLALPFLLIGFVPALGRWLPRPGRWMETMKQALAFPMYFTAAWLIWVLAMQRGADAVGLVLVAIILLAMALWWHERSRASRWPLRVLALVLALAAAWPLYRLTTVRAPSTTGTALPEGVVAYTPEKLAQLRAAGTPVFVNMTAEWCITCKANEHAVLDTDAFRDLLKRTGTVYVKGDWTDVNPAISAFLQQYRSPGVPLYVVFPKGGGEGRVLPSVLTPGLMAKELGRAAGTDGAVLQKPAS